MLNQASLLRYDEKILNYYLDDIVPLCDQLYRVAFGMIFSHLGAHKLCERAYLEVASELAEVAEKKKPLLKLLKNLWHAYIPLSKRDWEKSKDPIVQQLSGIPEKPRFCLLITDTLGISPEDASEALGWNIAQYYKDLAQARKILILDNKTK